MIKDNSNEKRRQEFKRRVYRLMLDIIKFCESLPKDFVTRKIAEQLIRSGTSIGANYFEAFSSSSKKEFVNYFHISLKSNNESLFWVCLLRDAKKCRSDLSEKLIEELKETAKIFASSILTMKNKRNI